MEGVGIFVEGEGSIHDFISLRCVSRFAVDEKDRGAGIVEDSLHGIESTVVPYLDSDIFFQSLLPYHTSELPRKFSEKMELGEWFSGEWLSRFLIRYDQFNLLGSIGRVFLLDRVSRCH